ncbi:MAG: hypothetical protein KatS3mg004_2826 [Bryobacteraceae bacterium]|nr:MAG: hypothetical protein KatS3mg004_2826 [Bryobacteraceae bacterium]
MHLLAADDGATAAEMERELAVTPGHVQARLQLANYWVKQGETTRGLPSARQAVQLVPVDFIAHQILSRLLLDLGEFKESIHAPEPAVRLAPE